MSDNQYMSISFMSIPPAMADQIVDAITDIAGATSYSVFFADEDVTVAPDEAMTGDQKFRLACIDRARKDVVGALALRALSEAERFEILLLADRYADSLISEVKS